jgi:alpha-beta hydrolase superfamily lysophospholipase
MPHRPPVRVRQIIGVSALAVAALLAVVGFATGLTSVVFARRIVTPPRRREEDVRILGIRNNQIDLSATLDSLTPGSYSLWFRQARGHARVGEILDYSASMVTRELLGVDVGDLGGAARGRFGGWFYLSPDDLECDWSDVVVQTELGPAPAWLVEAEGGSVRWVIHVHGRAARRQETLRAIPVFREAGFTSLAISYRNDGDAPESADRRYGLGDTEWRDVEAAMQYAVDRGAQQIVLMGWSMGGAIALQALTRSGLVSRVSGVVLESPVVDWITALQYQGVLNRLPPLVRHWALVLLSRRWGGVMTGQRIPIDLRRLDLVARAAELHTPILLLHSVDDGFVPATASAALAAARPDLVTYEEFRTARHTKLWNYDRARWNGVIARWLDNLTTG